MAARLDSILMHTVLPQWHFTIGYHLVSSVQIKWRHDVIGAGQTLERAVRSSMLVDILCGNVKWGLWLTLTLSFATPLATKVYMHDIYCCALFWVHTTILISLFAKDQCEKLQSSREKLERELSELRSCKKTLEEMHDGEVQKCQLLQV